MSSLSGWLGHEFTGAYAGSKFALEGVVESLARETAHLGIKTLLVEPGQFRTRLLSPGNALSEVSRIDDYADQSRALIGSFAAADEKQRGDPAKAVQIVLDFVRGEGVVAGRKREELPLRVPLGPDCYEVLKMKSEETLGLLREWEGVINSTDL